MFLYVMCYGNAEDHFVVYSLLGFLLVRIAKSAGEMPITLVLDNARYQKCPIVRELAEKLTIEFLYLPAYSPNLNLIERLWKFVKKKCLYSKYYTEFSDFKRAITDCLNQTSHHLQIGIGNFTYATFSDCSKTQLPAA